MFSTNKSSRFYEPTNVEEEALLPLDDLVVDTSDSSEEVEVTSLHWKNNSTKQPFLLDEINDCISILEESMRNIPSYIDCRNKAHHFDMGLKIITAIASLGAPGVAAYFVCSAHDYLLNYLQKQLEALQSAMNEMSGEIQNTSKVIEILEKERESELNQIPWPNIKLELNKYWRDWQHVEFLVDDYYLSDINCEATLNLQGLPGYMRDDGSTEVRNPCFLIEHNYSLPSFLAYLCAQPEVSRHRCDLYREIDPALIMQQEKVYQSYRNISDLRSQIFTMQSKTYEMQPQYDALAAQSTYDNTSLWLLGTASVGSVAVIALLGYKFKKVRELYKRDIESADSLFACIKDPLILNRIANLCSRLAIKMDLSVLQLHAILKENADMLYLKQKRRLTFLSSDIAGTLPREVNKLILDAAELLPAQLPCNQPTGI